MNSIVGTRTTRIERKIYKIKGGSRGVRGSVSPYFYDYQ